MDYDNTGRTHPTHVGSTELAGPVDPATFKQDVYQTANRAAVKHDEDGDRAQVMYFDLPPQTLGTRPQRVRVEGDDVAAVLDPAAETVSYSVTSTTDFEEDELPDTAANRAVFAVLDEYADVDAERVEAAVAAAYEDFREQATDTTFPSLDDADPAPVDGPFYGYTNREPDETEEAEWGMGDMPA